MEQYFQGFGEPIFTVDAGRIIADGRLNGWSIASGLRSIVSFAAEHPNTRLVVNMSWGTSESELGQEALFETLSDCGIVFVAAAGNDGSATCSFPAGYRGVIGVSSVQSNTFDRAEYANYGECVKVAVSDDRATWNWDWQHPNPTPGTNSTAPKG